MALKDPIQDYIELVEQGSLLVSEYTWKALERHRNDLKRIGDPDFPYIYKPELGIHVIDMIERMPDTKTGVPYPLFSAQKFILMSIYSWVHKDTGYRRFRKAYITMARKNGKSILLSGMANYGLLYGKTPVSGRQIYTTAQTRDQAKLVFNMAKSTMAAMARVSPHIRKYTKLLNNQMEYGSNFVRPLAADANTLDGLDVYIGILDEYALSKDSRILDVLATATAQQDEPLIAIISTRSTELNGPMATDEDPYAKKILDGSIMDDNYFAAIYELDDESEIQDQSKWIKANPILEVESVRQRTLDTISGSLRQALETNNTAETFVKLFNVWQRPKKQLYLDYTDWQEARIDKDLVDIKGRKIWIGLDLARVNDLSSVSWAVQMDDYMYVDSYSFVASKGGIAQKIKRDHINYIDLEKAGYCSISTLSHGMIDDSTIVQFIESLVINNDMDLQGIYYDRAFSGPIIQGLSNSFMSLMVEVAQGWQTLTSPIKQFEIDLASGRIKHSNNPLLNRAVNNAFLKQTNDSVMIDKGMNREKIDPLAALINAYVEAQHVDFNVDDSFYLSDEFSF